MTVVMVCPVCHVEIRRHDLQTARACLALLALNDPTCMRATFALPVKDYAMDPRD